MWRLVLAVIAFVLALAVLKMVILALLLAGLIFRTKITIGLLGLFGLMALIRAQPLVGLGATALFIIVAVGMKKKEERERNLLTTDEPDPV